MAVGDEKFHAAIEVEVGHRDAEAEPVERRHVKSRTARDVLESRRPEATIERVRVVVEVREIQVEHAVAIVIARRDAHARLGLAVAIHGAAEGETNLVVRAVGTPPEQKVGLRVVGDIDVGEPVGREVGDRHAERLVARAVEAQRAGRGREGAVTLVDIAFVRHRLDVAGMADARLSGGIPAIDRIAGVVVEVVADVEIEIAVGVEIGPRSRRTPARIADAGLGRHVDERAVPEVSIERVGPDVRDVDIVEAVLVAVTDRHTLAIRPLVDARGKRDVDKAFTATVPEELIAWLCRAVGSGRITALYEVQVPPAVTIEVEPAGPTSDRLDHQRLPGLAIRVEVLEATRCGGVLERGRRRQRGPQRRPTPQRTFEAEERR